MSFVVDGDDRVMHQVESQLAKLINVTALQDVTAMPVVVREMALIKVSAESGENRTEIMQMADVFRAKIVDVGHSALTLEVTGEQDKVDSLIDLLKRFGILEIARTGQVAMVRAAARENGNGR
jgi:acetolactate synthase-1/3 small subunit